MILQSQKSRTYKDKDYKKFWAVIPNNIVEKLHWKMGDELKVNIKENGLFIEKFK